MSENELRFHGGGLGAFGFIYFYPFINTFALMLHRDLHSYPMYVKEIVLYDQIQGMITVMIKLIKDNVNTVTGFHGCFIVNSSCIVKATKFNLVTV